MAFSISDPSWLVRTVSVVLRCEHLRASKDDGSSGAGKLSLRLLRLDLLDRTAGIAPGGKAPAHMGDRLQPHVLRGLVRQRRTHSAGVMKDELLVALKDRLRVGAGRIDPEFQHAAGAGERAGNSSIALDLAGIADIDDHDLLALRSLE